MKKSILFLFLVLVGMTSYAQTNTQTIRGTVVDADTKETLIGATVMLLNSDPIIGTSCDINGHFVLQNVPVGRQDIQVSMLGYTPYVANELLVSTGKEPFLEINLQAADNELQEVVVRVRKDAPLNSMTTLSARQFTVEETQRYAGGLDDPARLVSAFAGVATPSVSSNGISVRGNNPQGLLWRIEGVEVPNPNHFANLTVTGGGLLTVISNQMMKNSDFLTGAFPAEYGNATSGVFDIQLRTGNSNKREYTIQAGLLGLDFAAEGAFKKGKNASYLLNYRYSTLGLIAAILPDDAGIPKYQDLSFKMNFPTRSGTFSFWGIGALDALKTNALDSLDWQADSDRDTADDNLYLYASGLSHKIIFKEKTALNTTLSASGTGLRHVEERLNDALQFHPLSNVKNNTQRYIFQSNINHYFGKKHSNRTGFYVNHLRYNIDIQEALTEEMPLTSLVKADGNANLLQVFSQSKFNPTPELTLNVGVHYQHFMLNNNNSIEPRIGIKYAIHPNHSLALAYGVHSRSEILPVYFVNNNGTFPNKNLDLMRSTHYGLAYAVKLNDHLRLNIEPYFQRLNNVPISPDSYISTLNIENNIFFNDALTSEGKGRNIGIDVTLERFVKKGFYYLLTASVFDAKYTGADGKERNTRFNKNYVFNGLIGKEWAIGKEKNNSLGINLRLNYLGGNRIEPIDELASLATKEIIYAETNNQLAFSAQFDDAPIFSFTINYRKNKPNYASTWALKVLNATATEEFVDDFYNLKTNQLDQKYNGIFIPNLSYKIEF